jgi:hypothetical protein
MSKLSLEAQKLNDRPKYKRLPLKYQSGGIAPFWVYTPLPYAGRDTSQT